MDDYRVMVGFLDHPKTRRLKRRIGRDAVETVLRLWEFATSNASRRTGDLTGMDNEAIADACRWGDDPDKLVGALVDSGYLDGEPFAYRLHDWRETNPYVATWQERSENAKAAANARWGKRDAPRMRPAMPITPSGNAPSPDPYPVPTPDPVPSPSPDPKTPLSTSKKPKSTARDPRIDEVISHYQMHHPRAKPGTKEKAKIRDRLQEGYSVADLCKAIDGCHRTPHNLGKTDSNNQTYLQLELIMRTSGHVTRFLENFDRFEPGSINSLTLTDVTRHNLAAAKEFMEMTHDDD